MKISLYQIITLLLPIILFAFIVRVEFDTDSIFQSKRTKSPHNQQSGTQENPFERFKGEWVLKDDIFESDFDGVYKKDVNPNRSFMVKELGTKNSIVWIEDFDGFMVDIFWTYDFKKKQIHHLSMATDIARGLGNFKENGNLELKLTYENGCKGCYRIYSFQWKSDSEFFFRANLFKDEKPTGDYYGGTFLKKTDIK